MKQIFYKPAGVKFEKFNNIQSHDTLYRINNTSIGLSIKTKDGHVFFQKNIEYMEEAKEILKKMKACDSDEIIISCIGEKDKIFYGLRNPLYITPRGIKEYIFSCQLFPDANYEDQIVLFHNGDVSTYIIVNKIVTSLLQKTDIKSYICEDMNISNISNHIIILRAGKKNETIKIGNWDKQEDWFVSNIADKQKNSITPMGTNDYLFSHMGYVQNNYENNNKAKFVQKLFTINISNNIKYEKIVSLFNNIDKINTDGIFFIPEPLSFYKISDNTEKFIYLRNQFSPDTMIVERKDFNGVFEELFLSATDRYGFWDIEEKITTKNIDCLINDTELKISRNGYNSKLKKISKKIISINLLYLLYEKKYNKEESYMSNVRY